MKHLGGRRDRGAGPVTALMVMAILAILFAAGFTALGAAASDERSSAQHAADAAALAGAKQIVETAAVPLTLPGFLTPPGIYAVLSASACSPVGSVQASALAGANGASVTRYWNAYTDQVVVDVRMLRSGSPGDTARASATAGTTFRPSECVVDPAFVATLEMLRVGPPVPTWMTCSGRTKVFLFFNPESKMYTLKDAPAFIHSFDVRLV